MEYHSLYYESDPKVTGAKNNDQALADWAKLAPLVPGAASLQDFVEGPNWRDNIATFPGFDAVLPIDLAPRLHFTDLLQCYRQKIGYVVGPRLRALLASHHLPPHRFYPVRMFQKGREVDARGYTWFYFIPIGRGPEIDFAHMEYDTKMWEYKTKLPPPPIRDYVEFDTAQALSRERTGGYGMPWKKIRLGSAFDRRLDFFGFCWISGTNYVSGRLRAAMEAEGITGHCFKPDQVLEFPAG